jgi:hypothetical protein
MIRSVLTIYLAPILYPRMVSEIAEADPHMMMQRVWHSHRNTKPHNAVGHAQRIDIPVAQKKHTCDYPPDQRDRCQNRIGQVRQCEDGSRNDDGG